MTHGWTAFCTVNPERESIHKAILGVTQRSCSVEELLNSKPTGYLKMAQRMVAQFFSGATDILIQTDFDADGVTSGVFWERYLAKKTPVRVVIPSRTQGHATLEPLIQALQLRRPSHILILDAGTNLIDKLIPHLGDAKALIIDHHQPEGVFEHKDDRITIINPHILPGNKNENDLSTAGLSYYLLPDNDLKSKLLAGIGQIGDVMPLSPLSFQIARDTIQRLKGNLPASLVPLLPQDTTIQALSFQTIPKINAVSRMSHPMLIYQLLSNDNPPEAMFREIERLNTERREVTTKYYARIIPQITKDKVQVLYVADMPAAIAGLLASRICNELFQPVLCVCDRGDGTLSGSFRSPVDINLSEFIQNMKTQGVCYGGGGHKRAAGLSLKKSNLPKLRECIQALEVKDVLRPYLPMPIMPFQVLAEVYRELEPFGSGTPPPYWGIPYFKATRTPLYTREEGRHWASKGELSTPLGPINYLDLLKVKWREAGMIFGQIDWDNYTQQNILRIEDVV